MDKGKTGETVMTVLSELLADSLTEVNPGLPLGILEARVKGRLEYLKDRRSRSTKKALETLSRENLISISSNQYKENVYSLKFENYHDLWKLLNFIYENAPPYVYHAEETTKSPNQQETSDQPKDGGITYYFDIIVFLPIAMHIELEKIGNSTEVLSDYMVERNMYTQREFLENVFINLVRGNIFLERIGPDRELSKKFNDLLGISGWKPDKYWNIRFLIYISINYWLRILRGKISSHEVYTYLKGESLSIIEGNDKDWPSDREVEDRIFTDIEVLVKGYQNLLSKDVRG